MDAMRRTAKGTLAGLTGRERRRRRRRAAHRPGLLRRGADRAVRRAARALRRRRRAGARRHPRLHRGDQRAHRRGQRGPDELPAEYAALGASPERWTPSDTAAMAVLLVTQFTVSNGGEEVNAAMRHAFRKRFGRRWRGPFKDLRTANDPEAFTVSKTAAPVRHPGRARRGLNAVPDPGSIEPRNPQIERAGRRRAGRRRAALPAWARSVIGIRRQPARRDVERPARPRPALADRPGARGDGPAGRLLLAADLRRSTSCTAAASTARA